MQVEFDCAFGMCRSRLYCTAGNRHNSNNNNNNNKFDETTDHITRISTFPILAKEHYIKGLDTVCAGLHFNMCKDMGVKLGSEHWYEHVPKLLETGHEGKANILWNKTSANRQNRP